MFSSKQNTDSNFGQIFIICSHSIRQLVDIFIKIFTPQGVSSDKTLYFCQVTQGTLVGFDINHETRISSTADLHLGLALHLNARIIGEMIVI